MNYDVLGTVFGTASSASFRDLLIEELAEESFRKRFIAWPEGPKLEAVFQEFANLRNHHIFTSCAGAIDGTFIKINCPFSQTSDPSEFNSYKKYYAIQVLAVALPNFVISYVFAGMPGSRTDKFVLKRSSLYRRVRDFLPEGAYLLGDGGFQLFIWLMIPFTAAQVAGKKVSDYIKAKRRAYDFSQKSHRVVVEQAFGILKGRFRCLRNGLSCHLRNVEAHVIACIVLHNICILQNDLWDQRPTQQDDESDEPDHDPDQGLDTPQWMVVHPTCEEHQHTDPDDAATQPTDAELKAAGKRAKNARPEDDPVKAEYQRNYLVEDAAHKLG